MVIWIKGGNLIFLPLDFFDQAYAWYGLKSSQLYVVLSLLRSTYQSQNKFILSQPLWQFWLVLYPIIARAKHMMRNGNKQGNWTFHSVKKWEFLSHCQITSSGPLFIYFPNEYFATAEVLLKYVWAQISAIFPNIMY